MGSKQESLGAQVASSTKEDVQEWQERHDKDSQSDAVRELLHIGLRESDSPLLSRAREIAFDTMWYLSMVSAVVMLAGWTTQVMAVGDGVKLGLLIAVFAFLPLTMIELYKIAKGESELRDTA